MDHTCNWHMAVIVCAQDLLMPGSRHHGVFGQSKNPLVGSSWVWVLIPL